MIRRGMTREQIEAMVAAEGWEVLQDKECKDEFCGDVWTELTIWQDDHAVAVGLDEEGVYEIQFIPRWAL